MAARPAPNRNVQRWICTDSQVRLARAEELPAERDRRRRDRRLHAERRDESPLPGNSSGDQLVELWVRGAFLIALTRSARSSRYQPFRH